MSGLYNGSVVIGTITVPSTPADGNEVFLGFVPGSIKLTVLSGTNVGQTASWNSAMADASAIVSDALISSAGIVPIKNVIDKSDGFSLANLAGVASTAGDVISYEATREAL